MVIFLSACFSTRDFFFFFFWWVSVDPLGLWWLNRAAVKASYELFYTDAKHIGFKKRNACCCLFGVVLFCASNVVWHCTAKRQCHIPCSAPHHTVPRKQQRPKFSSGLPCPQTLTLTNTLGTSWTDVCEAEWTHLQMCLSCFRHSSWSGWPSQRKWFTTWSSPCLRPLCSYWFSRNTHLLLLCVSLSHKVESDGNFTRTRRVLKP